MDEENTYVDDILFSLIKQYTETRSIGMIYKYEIGPAPDMRDTFSLDDTDEDSITYYSDDMLKKIKALDHLKDVKIIKKYKIHSNNSVEYALCHINEANLPVDFLNISNNKFSTLTEKPKNDYDKNHIKWSDVTLYINDYGADDCSIDLLYKVKKRKCEKISIESTFNLKPGKQNYRILIYLTQKKRISYEILNQKTPNKDEVANFRQSITTIRNILMEHFNTDDNPLISMGNKEYEAKFNPGGFYKEYEIDNTPSFNDNIMSKSL